MCVSVDYHQRGGRSDNATAASGIVDRPSNKRKRNEENPTNRNSSWDAVSSSGENSMHRTTNKGRNTERVRARDEHTAEVVQRRNSFDSVSSDGYASMRTYAEFHSETCAKFVLI